MGITQILCLFLVFVFDPILANFESKSGILSSLLYDAEEGEYSGDNFIFNLFFDKLSFNHRNKLTKII
jgi:hypothetical protein